MDNYKLTLLRKAIDNVAKKHKIEDRAKDVSWENPVLTDVVL